MNGFSFRRLVGVTLVTAIIVLGMQWTERGVAMASPTVHAIPAHRVQKPRFLQERSVNSRA
jgi:hypothetical protein